MLGCDGFEVGWALGLIGFSVGMLEGCEVGRPKGCFEGCPDGCEVGMLVGLDLGCPEGCEVGWWDGSAVGLQCG